MNNLVFMGTPEFAVPTLRALANTDWRPALVVTQPDRPSGRRRKLTPPPVKVAAQELGIPVLQPEDVNDAESFAAIAALQPRVIVTAAYGGYIRKPLRKLAPLGCINLHPSLLPLHRGAAPVNFTLFAGDTVTGNTVYRMTAKMDAGPILYQTRTDIGEDECATTLLARLAESGAQDVLHTLDKLAAGEITEQPQNHDLATHTSKIDSDTLPIDWTLSASEIRRHVRGLAESPGALAQFRGARLKVIACRETEGGGEPGAVLELRKNEGVVVACGKGALLLTRVQPQGKKIMDAWAWNLGARIEAGERLL